MGAGFQLLLASDRQRVPHPRSKRSMSATGPKLDFLRCPLMRSYPGHSGDQTRPDPRYPELWVDALAKSELSPRLKRVFFLGSNPSTLCAMYLNGSAARCGEIPPSGQA